MKKRHDLDAFNRDMHSAHCVTATGRVDGSAVHAFNRDMHSAHGFDISRGTYHRVDGAAIHPTCQPRPQCAHAEASRD